MNYENFIEFVCRKLKEHYSIDGKEVQVNQTKVVKNNGLELDAITLYKEKSNVSPTLYVKQYYDIYEKCNDEEYVMNSIYDFFDIQKNDDIFNANLYLDFEHIRPNIIFRLVNYDMNKNRLEHIPYLPYKDLAITFRWMVNLDELGISTMLISNDELDNWGITISELFEAAILNTERIFPGRIDNLFLTIMDKLDPEEEGIKLSKVLNTDMNRPENQLYIVTNRIGINGAAAILYPGMLDRMADMVDSNIYILPSSVHELLFLPEEQSEDVDMLKELVKEVNHTVVNRTEILSENIYYYNRISRELNIVE